jgi:putative acetyltransferase
MWMRKNMITVRPAVSDDFGLLLNIWRGAVEATHSFLSPDDIDWYEPYVAEYIGAATDLRVAARQADRARSSAPSGPLGFIAYEAGAIQMLFVAPEVHGTGVGTALLKAVRDTARDSGVAELAVDVNEANESGCRFYAARGFQVTGRSPLDGQGRTFPLLHLRLALDRG